MNNYDIHETKHFSNMADGWWDLKGPCKPLHDLNPIRLQFINDRVSLSGKKILDVGCGGGILTENLAKRGAIVTGIDAAPELIDAAKLHASNLYASHSTLTPITYLHSTIEAFLEHHPELKHTFDIITCLELLEHVPDPESLINTCSQLIKSEGTLFFSTLNRTLKSYLLAIIGAERVLNILPKHTHQYEKFIRPSELDKALRKVNLKITDITGLRYNPITGNAALTPDVSVNYIVCAH